MAAQWPLLAYAGMTLLLCGWKWKAGEMFMQNPDSIAFTWFLNWWPFALSQQIDPFITHHLGQPVGYNLWWVTSIPTLAILGWPVTALAGPIATWNVLSLLAPVLSAYACYWLLLYLSGEQWPSFIGGLTFGFSTYQTSHLVGHLCLTFLPLLPVMLLLAVARARHDLSRVKYIVLLSICAAAQFGVSAEVLATFGLFAMIAFAVFYPSYRRKADMNGLAVDTLICVVLAVAAVSPALLSMYRSLHTMPEVIRGGDFFSTDLLNFVVPHPLTWLGGEHFEWISSRFTGGYFEEGAYLGVPLAVITGWSAWERRRTRWMLPLVLVLLAGVLLTLGPVLQVAGLKTLVPMPWAVVDRVPVIRNALPMRLTMYVSLTVAVMLTMWLCRRREAPVNTFLRYGLAAVACAFLIPNPKNFTFSEVVMSKALAPEVIDRNIAPNSTVIVLPYAPYGASMIWQIESGMKFKMAGGYLGPPPLFFTQSPGWHTLNYSPLPADHAEFENNINAFVAAAGVSTVVVTAGPTHDPERTEAYRRAILALPWERSMDGNAIFMKVPPMDKLQYVTVRGDYWGDPLGKDFWIGKQVEVDNRSSSSRTVSLGRFAAPLALGDLTISSTIAGVTKHYRMANDRIEIEVPPRASARITVDKTWKPSVWMRNSDTRTLSIVMRIRGWD